MLNYYNIILTIMEEKILNKKKIIILAASVVAVLAIIVGVTILACNNSKKGGSDGSSTPDRIVSAYAVDGITGDEYELADDEKKLVVEAFDSFEFVEGGEMPKYHTCIVLKSYYNKEYNLKYSDAEEMLYLTGDKEVGFYKCSADVAELLRIYEMKYGHGTMIDYAGRN